MPLYVTLAALLLGVGADVTAFGRSWTLSYIDVVAVTIGIAGAGRAWRRREVRLDAAALGYLGILFVVGMQLLVRDGAAAIIGGSSRFTSALLLLFGLSQFVAASHEPWEVRWRWPLAVGVFGSALALWVLVPFVRALADPAVTNFYDVKNAVVTPMGASNYLAAFLLVAFLVSLVHAVEQRRRWFGYAGLTLIGLLATMSRGAVLAGLVVLLGLTYTWRRRHVLVRAVAVVGLAAVAFGVVLVAAATVAGSGPSTTAAPPSSTSSTAGGAEPGTTDGTVVEPTRRGLARLDGVLSEIAVGGRQQLYRASWRAFTEHPVVGVGLNQLDTYSGAGGHPPHVNAHNLVLQALATTGLLGALAYLTIWSVLLARLWRLPTGTARTALLAGVVALLLHAQVEALTHTRAVEALLACVLAIAGAAPGAFGIRTLRWAGSEQSPTEGQG